MLTNMLSRNSSSSVYLYKFPSMGNGDHGKQHSDHSLYSELNLEVFQCSMSNIMSNFKVEMNNMTIWYLLVHNHQSFFSLHRHSVGLMDCLHHFYPLLLTL